jgi:dihydrolipoamide dehydrogenase
MIVEGIFGPLPLRAIPEYPGSYFRSFIFSKHQLHFKEIIVTMTLKIAILGAGPGGYVAAIRAAQLGADVTLIEKARVGGTCLNYGCIPSKILKRTADLLEDFRRAKEFGIEIDSSPACTMKSLMARKETILRNQQKGILALLKNSRIRYVTGNASIREHNLLEYTDDNGHVNEVRWDRLILATGSRPLSLPSFPLDGRAILSSNDALALNHIPKSITIFGGGVIGCELAFIFNSFGSKVTIVEGFDRLLPLPSVDQDCSKIIAREMKKRKITVLLNKTVLSAVSSGDNLEIGVGPSPFAGDLREKERQIIRESSDRLLVCIGRTPNSDNLGLAGIGVEVDEKGWIRVDEMMRTTAPDVFAIGDVLGPAKVMLAHVASSEGEIAAENCLGAGRKMSYEIIPSAIFTMPEIGNVGLSEQEARKRYQDVQADTVLFRTTGKAQVLGELAGEVKIVSRSGPGTILGVHITGAHASDLIAEGALAIRMGATVQDLATTIHAHPTLPEIMLEAAFKAIGRPLHG